MCKQHVRARTGALKLAQNRDVHCLVAIALARAGDSAEAEKLATELEKTFPLDTLIQRYWLPSIRAAIALDRKQPDKAIEFLKMTSDRELSMDYLTAIAVSLYPAYLRGEAYLMLHDGTRAAAEFQKFLDYRRLVGNFPLGALARLCLARAFALQNDKARSGNAYAEFLILWKDADPDLPLLKQAKSEYAKLR